MLKPVCLNDSTNPVIDTLSMINKDNINYLLKSFDIVKFLSETEKGQKVQQGLEQLAEQMLEQHAYVEPQKPAISVDEFELDEYAMDDNRVEEGIDPSVPI